MREVTLR